MAEVVFGRSFEMLSTPGSRFILEVIEAHLFRFSLAYQLPQFVDFKIDRILIRGMAEKAKAFQAASKEIAEARKMEGELKNKDIYGAVLAAKDPNTGESFSSMELWAESTLLIIAGKTNFP